MIHREIFLAPGIHSWIWHLSGRCVHGVVSLKFFWPLHRASRSRSCGSWEVSWCSRSACTVTGTPGAPHKTHHLTRTVLKLLPFGSGACYHNQLPRKLQDVWIFRQRGRESFIHKPHTGRSMGVGIRWTCRPGFPGCLFLPWKANQLRWVLPSLYVKKLLPFRILWGFSFRLVILGT